MSENKTKTNKTEGLLDEKQRSSKKEIICYVCNKKGHYARECSSRKKEINRLLVRDYVPVKTVVSDKLSIKPEIANSGTSEIAKQIEDNERCLEIPVTVNGARIMAIMDTGANISVISMNLVDKYKWMVTSKQGVIRQAMNEVPRIGAVEYAEVRAGKQSVIVPLEVAKLSGDTQMLLGMDLFGKLGFSLNNLPFSWPEEKKVEIEVHVVKEAPEIDLPSGVGLDGIAEEWHQVLSDNAALPEGNVCRLTEAELGIPTGDSKPVYVRQYPIPHALMSRVRDRVEQWDKAGITVEAPWNCPYNLAMLCADKPAKEIGDKDDVRVCLDTRPLNEKITEVPDSSMPLLRDVLDRLGEFKWISVIDLADSYHQFPLKLEDQQKTCFTFEGKRRMFTVVPFGLKIMTGHMQKFMEMLLGDLGVVPFQDDVAIASKTEEEHITKVKEVLERLTYKAGLRLRIKKCKFFKTEARVLGFIVSRTGI